MASIPVNGSRLIELDALRGFAVMGILAMNIMAFAMPEMAYINPAVYGGSGGIDLATWFGAFVLFDGKMRGLFSLLFGASMMLIIARADTNRQSALDLGMPARSAAATHYTRMAWLAIFGLFHFFFIWWGDILFLYAVIGSIAFLFRKWDPARLIKWAVLGYLAGCLLLSIAFGSMIMLKMEATSAGANAEIVTDYQELIDDLGVDPESLDEEIALHKSSYFAITTSKLTNDYMALIATPTIMLFETLPLMMIGMALLKSGFLTGQADRSSYRRFAILGIAIGAVLYALLASVLIWSGFDTIIALNIQMGWSMLPRLIMTTGYLCALILLIHRFQHSALMARVAAAGRAAFTNYLGTSIVMTTIFYGYGFNLFGEVGRATLYVFVIGMWALMLLWSKPWLMHFRYGPLEWLWRSLARGQLQPMRIR